MNQNERMNAHKVNAYHRALAADTAWSILLREQFGKAAGDVRYIKAGEGDPGTPLRAAYEEFREATEIWRNAI